MNEDATKVRVLFQNDNKKLVVSLPVYDLGSKSMRFSNLKNLTLIASNLSNEDRLTDISFQNLLKTFIANEIHLETLILKFHRLSVNCVKDIGKYMYIKSTLKFLDLEGNDINGDTISPLRLNEKNTCPLESLNLSSNPLGQEGGMALAHALSKNNSVKALYVNNCGIPLTSLIAIFTSISRSTSSSLTAIDEEGNAIYNPDPSCLEIFEIDRPLLCSNSNKEEEGTDHLSRLLLADSPLSTLSLCQHNMQDFGARLLSDSLARSLGCMTSLNLDRNNIGVAGTEAIASFLIIQTQQQEAGVLPKNRKFSGPGLKTLKLSYNIIGNDGAIALSEALKVNKSLTELTIKNNNIDEGLTAIAESLEFNNTIKKLSIFGNNFNEKSGKAFYRLIRNRLPYVGASIDISVYIVDGEYHQAEKSLDE
jgi:Ran GTPase-activating protein (RanGAP) involved in mRNA processing and transport